MKKLTSIVLSIICVAVFLGAIFIPSAKVVEGEKGKTIITVWQLDMFEGGVGSRASYLKSVAAMFEKKNNVLIMVESKTKEDAEELLAKNISPDIISFSSGIQGVLERAKSLDSDGFGGEYKGKTYAKCWCYGGYVKVKRKGKNPSQIILSKNKIKNIELACLYNQIDISNAQEFEPKRAYEEFMANENSLLIGSQRDIYRLKKKIDNFDIEPLDIFTDLLQYASILSNDNEKILQCEKFINYLCTEGQKNINNLGLLSIDKTANNANNGLIDRLFDKKYTYTTSAFLSEDEIFEIEKTVKDKKLTIEEKFKILKTSVKSLKLYHN